MANITLQEAYNRAKEALEAGEVDRAVAICQHVLRYYPRYIEGYRLLGEAYLEHGGLSEAGRLFSHALSCDPQHVLAHVGRAIIAEEHDLIEIAISELERGFEVDPSIGELRAELLRLYRVRYGTAGASIRTTPIGLAYTHLRAGLLEPAIAEFSRITDAQPDRWDGQVALLEALWRNEQLIDVAHLAAAILADHPNCVKANWILGYLHWTGDKLDSGREYLSAAVALDPDYGTARKLWANTPWPLDSVVTAEQPALVPGWAQGELVMEEDLNLALPMTLDEEPLATPPARRITTALAPEDVEAEAAPSPYNTTALREEEVESEVEAVPIAAEAEWSEELDSLAGGSLDVILPMPEAGDEPALPESTSLLDTVLRVPAAPDEPFLTAPSEDVATPLLTDEMAMPLLTDDEPPLLAEIVPAATPAPPPPLGDWFQQWAVAALNPAPPVAAAPPFERAEAAEAAPLVTDEGEPVPLEDAVAGAPEDAEPPVLAEAPAPADDAATGISAAPAPVESAADLEPPAAEELDDTGDTAAPTDAEASAHPLGAAERAETSTGDVIDEIPAFLRMPEATAAPTEDSAAPPAPIAVSSDEATGAVTLVEEDTAAAPLEYQTMPVSATPEEAVEQFAVPIEPVEATALADDDAAPLMEPTPADEPAFLMGEATESPVEAAPADEPASLIGEATDSPGEPTLADEPDSPAVEDTGSLMGAAPADEPTPPLIEAAESPVELTPADEPTSPLGEDADEATTVTDPLAASLTGDEPDAADEPAAALSAEPTGAPDRAEENAPIPFAATDDAAETPPAALAAPPDEEAQPVGLPLVVEDSPAAAAHSPAPSPPFTSPDTSPVPTPDDGHRPAPTPETSADSAMKENTMAPSYKEDDDQERQFEFDWEREGLPDYLKPFLAEDSSPPAAVPPAPPTGPGNLGGAPFGGASTDAGLPDWLSGPPGPAPAAPAPSPFGAAPGGSMGGAGGFGLPDASAPGAAPGNELEMEGLPDWLRGGASPAQPPAAMPPPAPSSSARAGNMDEEGLPSWLQGGNPTAPPPAPTPFNVSDNMDSEGLPSWLQSSPPPPPAPAPQGGMGGAQPFDFGQMSGSVQPFDFGPAPAAPQGGMGGVQPFDFGLPPAPTPAAPQGGAGNAQSFDFGGMGGDLGVQPFDFGLPAAPPPAPPGGMGNVQPFDFGGMGGDLGGVQPFDFGSGAAPSTPQGGMGVQPFDFSIPPAPPAPPAQTGGMGGAQAGDFGGVQPFDFGLPAAPPPAPSGGMGNVPPFDFGPMGGDLGGVSPFDFGAAPPPAAQGGMGGVQPFDFGAAPAPAQPGNWGAAPAEDVDDFLDFLTASEETPAATMPGGADLGGAAAQPFAFDSFDFGATMPPIPPAPPVAMPPPPTDVSPFNPEEFNFQPFSFGQETPAPGLGAPPAFGMGGGTGLEDIPGIQPFSFDDMNLDLPTSAGGDSFGRRAGDHGASFDDEEEEENRGYSWQRPSGGTPSRRDRPQEEAPEPAGESIFDKARRRKKELEAAMQAAALPEPVAEVPAAELIEPLEATDLWPTFDDDEIAAAAAVPAVPAFPFTPAATAADEAAAAVEAFDFSMLDAGPTDEGTTAGAFDMTAVQPFDINAFTAPPDLPAFDFTSLDMPAEPVPAAPPRAEAFDFGSESVAAEIPVAATPDLTPGQPEQLWSVPGEAAPAEAGAGGEFDFSGLPRFDLGDMDLTPEEQAYLLNDSAVSGIESNEAAPAQPPPAFSDSAALPSWLSGETTPAPAIPEPLAELESNALPSWMSSTTTTPSEEALTRAIETPAEPWTAPTFGEPEPIAAEVFGEEDMQAWPAPAEPMVPAAIEEEVVVAGTEEEAPAFAPAEPIFAAPEPIQTAPTLEERITPTAPALRFSGEPEVEDIRYNPPLPPVAAPLEVVPLEVAPLRPAAAITAPPTPAAPAAGRETMDDLLRHLEQNPNDAAARLVLAGVYEEREDYRRMLDQYRLLIKNREVPGNLLDLVIDNLRTLSEDMPDEATVHRVLGDAYRKAGMFQAAISQYNWLLSHSAK